MCISACGCGPTSPKTAEPRAGVRVGADTSNSARLAIGNPRPQPEARGAIAVAPAPARGVTLPPPDAAPDSVPAGASAPAAADPTFKPPLLRSAPALIEPPGTTRMAIDLDLRVDLDGRVREVRDVDAAVDRAARSAARRCALGMRFYPAQRAGLPVEAWSRRRFEFGAR
jgi:hypothetical protein